MSRAGLIYEKATLFVSPKTHHPPFSFSVRPLPKNQIKSAHFPFVCLDVFDASDMWFVELWTTRVDNVFATQMQKKKIGTGHTDKAPIDDGYAVLLVFCLS